LKIIVIIDLLTTSFTVNMLRTNVRIGMHYLPMGCVWSSIGLIRKS